MSGHNHPHAYEFAQGAHSHAAGARAGAGASPGVRGHASYGRSPSPSYPSYAHYDIPTSTSPSSPPRPGKKSSATSAVVEVKEGEYPEGWTEEDRRAEQAFLKTGLFNWREWLQWRYWIRTEWWYWYVALVVILIVVILMTIYHDKIVNWLIPFADKIQQVPAGWAIPIAIIFILSFPPLFGQEIVAILCGIVWGLWIGFGIVAAGTFLGEVGNYYAFKYCCRARAEKYERKNITYGCLAYVMREGGFWIVTAARLSAIPGHFTTAVFATCGMSFWIFLLATFVTLPKQIVVVYLGVIYKEKDKSSKDKIVSYSVLAVAVIITIGAMWWIYYEMHKVRLAVWREQRMHSKSRGIALNELRYRADPEAGGDATAPMLARASSAGSGGLAAPSAHGKHNSYINPYEISYNRDGDMSVYHVDAMTERIQLEQDIGSRIPHHGAPPVPAIPGEYARRGSPDGSARHSRRQTPSPRGGARVAAGFPQPHPAPAHTSPTRGHGNRF